MAPSTHIVVGLGFGDEGKGTIVDALARRCSSPPLVVRHNGGAQAGHNVVTSDGRHHTFSQFGSGSFVKDSRTLLSKHFIFHPQGFVREWAALNKTLGYTIDAPMIDERALVITPFQQSANQLREIERGAAAHGTCGLGIGETVGDSLDKEVAPYVVRAGDLRHPGVLCEKLGFLAGFKSHALPYDGDEMGRFLGRTIALFTSVGAGLNIVTPAEADRQIREAEHVIFEGAQGILLDEEYGFHPHTTWSKTTTCNADALYLNAPRGGSVKTIGVVRSYATRHGAGPFPSYSKWLTEILPELHNSSVSSQGVFRKGWFDLQLTKYALDVCPVDELAVTHLDAPMGAFFRMRTLYEGVVLKPGDLAHQEALGKALAAVLPLSIAKASYEESVHEFTRTLEYRLGVPVNCLSFGPIAEDKFWR